MNVENAVVPTREQIGEFGADGHEWGGPGSAPGSNPRTSRGDGHA